MSVATLEVNTSNSNNAEHHLWIGLSKALEQISSAGHFAEQRAEKLACAAAAEAMASLCTAFSEWLDTPAYKELVLQERERRQRGEPQEDATPVLLHAGLLRLCDDCATEARECEAIPAIARDQLVQSLTEVAKYGAEGVIYVVAQAAVIERALKAKVH